MKNELVGISVAVVCAIVMVGTILVPFIDDVSAETKTYTNEGMPYAAVDEDSHTITVNADGITVDGDSIDLSLFPSGFSQFTIVFGNPGTVRYDVTSLQVRTISDGVKNISFANGETITIEIDGTDATISSSDTSVTSLSISGITHYISVEGDWILCLNPVINSESTMVGEGQTHWGTTITTYVLDAYIYWIGTMAEVESTVLIYWSIGNWSAFEVSDVVVNTTEMDNGLYSVDSVVLDISATDKDSTSYSLTATYTYFLAPAEVEYDNPDYIGDTESVLLSVIPLFLIIAVLVTITYAVMRNRD